MLIEENQKSENEKSKSENHSGQHSTDSIVVKKSIDNEDQSKEEAT